MNRIGHLLLNIAAALYLFANGILGFNKGGEFKTMLNTLSISTGDGFGYILLIVLSVCAIAAGVFLLIQFFGTVIPVTDLILLIFIILWAVFIVIVDIVYAIQDKPDVLKYLLSLAAHLMILGTLITSSKRFA